MVLIQVQVSLRPCGSLLCGRAGSNHLLPPSRWLQTAPALSRSHRPSGAMPDSTAASLSSSSSPFPDATPQLPASPFPRPQSSQSPLTSSKSPTRVL